MRRALLLVLVLAPVPAAPAAAATLSVTTPARVFLPPQVQAVVGDTVRWTNTGSEPHDVQALDGAFGSAAFGPDAEFSRTFDAPGSHPYVCVLHRSTMTGQVDVWPVVLSGPGQPVARGEALTLTGRAPAGSGPVTIERAVGPAPFVALARVTPAADGTFSLTRPAEVAASYRAVAAGGPGAPIGVGVVDRVIVGLSATLGRRLTTLHIATDPARPGATALLQLYSPERFAWRRVAKGTLDDRGRMTLSLARDVRRRARIVVLGTDGAPLATSPAVTTWRPRRPSRPPRRPAPAPPGGHTGHG